MGISPLIEASGISGMFASRVFLPMFAAALMMRFGPQIGLIDDWGLLASVTAETAPNWLTSDWSLLVLAILSAAELSAHKVPEARELLTYVDQYGKPCAAVITYLGIANLQDQKFVESVIDHAGFLDYFIACAVALATWFIASSHNLVFGSMLEMDEDDDTGAIGLFSWAEDLYSFFGIVFLILFPLLMVLLIGLVVGAIFLLRKRAQWKEEQSKVNCGSCQQAMYRPALACGHCGAVNPEPMQVNWLGASTSRVVIDREDHPFQLVARKRCRKCAARLQERDPNQACQVCGTHPFADPLFVQKYDQRVLSRLPGVLVLCALCSLVPVLGLIVGVVYYRMALVAPYRRYIGWGRTFLLRWLVRVLFLFLILLQLVPGLGIITVPAMALISLWVYRSSFMSLVRFESVRPPVPALPV